MLNVNFGNTKAINSIKRESNNHSICGMWLFWCLYHAILIITALQYNLIHESVIPPTWFFFLKTPLVIRYLLWFHTQFRIICSSSTKNVWYFDRDCTESNDCFGYCGHLTILIISIHEHGMSVHLLIIL